jgi:aminoglycoside phosphotransferase (APT) family kinase protein
MAWRVTPELFRGLDGIDLAALGIPTEDEYVAAYCERTGRSRGFGLGVLHGLQLVPSGGDHAGDRKRVVDGTAASREAEELGRLARPVGEQAWALARSLGA